MIARTHRICWDTPRTRKVQQYQCLYTPCPMCPRSPSNNSAGDIGRQSMCGRGDCKKAYRQIPSGTPVAPRTRLSFQSVTRVYPRTRHRAHRDTAGPSYGEAFGGTRSRDIPITKVKLERVAYLNSVQLKDYRPCR